MIEKTPLVSFLIPTYNTGEYLEQCLKSIIKLEYPRNRIEIIIADGGSTDKTLAISKKYATCIIHNRMRIAEYGKKQAFDKSKGSIVVLLDADNVIASVDWLFRMLLPLKDKRGIIGVESNYLISSDFTSLNTYATLLVIVDPLARMLASRPFVLYKKNYIVKRFKKKSSPVAGANGFLWRKSVIEKYLTNQEALNEVELLNAIVAQHKVRIANVPGVGIYHYYCHGIRDYMNKRKKIAIKHLNRSVNSETWVSRIGYLRILLSIIYLASILGPTAETVYKLSRTRRIEWIWHPLISLLTIITYAVISIKDMSVNREIHG